MNLKGILSSDRAILLVCIVIAGIFWLFNKMSQDVRWDLDLPINYILAEDYVFSEKPRRTLTFTAEGNGWQLLALSRRSLDSLDLQVPPQEGNHNWNSEQLRQMIQEEKVGDQVEVMSINPFRISIKVEDAFSKCLPVQVEKNITYKSGYDILQKMSVDPDTVCIKGPRKLIENKKVWPTDTISLQKVNASREDEVALVNKNPQLIELSPSTVTYNLEVSEFTELKKYVSIRTVNPPDVDSISLFPRRALVSMNVPIDKYEAAQDHQIGLFTDLGKSEKGTNSARIQLPANLPDWMKNVSVQPDKVEFYFYENESETKEK